MSVTRHIPLARPSIGEREEELVLGVLRSGELANGPLVPAFEQAFAERVGTRYAVACSSGTAGLHMALHELDLGPGDEVVTSPYSFAASANVIRMAGATPVFADIDELTFNLDPAALEAAITPRTRAVLPVHIYGYPCDIEAVNRIARAHGLGVVEDACESVGAEIHGRQLGTHGNPAVFGFYPNKQMTTGEGGMVTTDDPDRARVFRSLVNQGHAGADSRRDLVHERLGFNYRMDEMSAAVGLAQLEKLDLMLAERNRLADRYDRLLARIDGVTVPYRGPHMRSWFVYVVRLAPGIDRTTVIQALADRGVATRAYFPAIHLQPAYLPLGHAPGELPVAERVAASTLALPFYVGLADDDQEHVAASLCDVVAAAEAQRT
ncbi:MAG: DegT/DnrJ/EryC1/StrS family aminotransferase [Gaiellales bacterium]